MVKSHCYLSDVIFKLGQNNFLLPAGSVALSFYAPTEDSGQKINSALEETQFTSQFVPLIIGLYEGHLGIGFPYPSFRQARGSIFLFICQQSLIHNVMRDILIFFQLLLTLSITNFGV